MMGLFKKTVVHLPIRLKENLKCTSGNPLKPLVADNMILLLLRRCYLELYYVCYLHVSK